MPWKETRVLDERTRFVVGYRDGGASMVELCAMFGISRKTGYKWLERYSVEGPDGLRDRSRAPHTHPNATSEEVEADVVSFRAEHPRWGPKKIRRRLCEQQPGVCWSTMGGILKRHGLVVPRCRRKRTPPYTRPFAMCAEPNDVWCADFKGWFLTGDGARCDPFTLSDAASRYLLRCQIVSRPSTAWVRPIMEAAFREYGLPLAIRTDNGPPFATPSLGGLSRLIIWWVKLGIVPERIERGCPEQNGRHERLHRTLKEQTADPPAANRRQQQRAFDAFRTEYNTERPHEALGQRSPDDVYSPSPRPYPRRLCDIEYPDGYHVRRVARCGRIRWRGGYIYVSRSLIAERVALAPRDDESWQLYFGPLAIGVWNDRTEKLSPMCPV